MAADDEVCAAGASRAAAAVRSERYQTIAEANRRNYAKVARYYADHAGCLVDSREQEQLAQLVTLAMETLGEPARPPRVLDACGGTGNAAMHLAARGCDVTLVDISPEMIEIYRQGCCSAGFEPKAEVAEIGAFLQGCREPFDLIVFSSALHHLEDPVAVLRLAASCLTPRGAVVTAFDPISQPALLRAMRLPLHWLQRARHSPRLVFTRVIPVLRRLLRGGEAYKQQAAIKIDDQNVGNLAEFHAVRGFDDRELLRRIEAVTGLRVARHERFIGNCPPAERWVRRLTGRPNQFQLILRRSSP